MPSRKPFPLIFCRSFIRIVRCYGLPDIHVEGIRCEPDGENLYYTVNGHELSLSASGVREVIFERGDFADR